MLVVGEKMSAKITSATRQFIACCPVFLRDISYALVRVVAKKYESHPSQMGENSTNSLDKQIASLFCLETTSKSDDPRSNTIRALRFVFEAIMLNKRGNSLDI